ncbi:hypothetical protein ETD83_19025 [Actinomadura soli]|uniref:Uncharacterized protein n=1 Tax=Actinomadura soli TaxID=2508997 RepID=A0A5C4JB01_9ACTN|nr:hypothetical protein ETD83_19025 [Actinomadura soli]
MRVGERVLSTDPVSGRTAPMPVIGLINGSGSKNLVGVGVAARGPGVLGAGSGAGVLQTTGGHPFWVDRPGVWRDARDLGPGDRLRRPDGQYVTVTATHPWTAERKVYNLTVRGYSGDFDEAHVVVEAAGAVVAAGHGEGEGVVALFGEGVHDGLDQTSS